MRAPFTFGPVYLHKGGAAHKEAAGECITCMCALTCYDLSKIGPFQLKRHRFMIFIVRVSCALAGSSGHLPPRSLPPHLQNQLGVLYALPAASLCVNKHLPRAPAAPPPGGGDAGDINAHNAHISIISSFGALPGYAHSQTTLSGDGTLGRHRHRAHARPPHGDLVQI